MRCANIGTSQPTMRDCGHELRSCVASCNKDKGCENNCRKASMNCM
jgi:hypothetical protein